MACFADTISSAEIDCCRLILKNDSGKTIMVFDLTSTVAFCASNVIIKDGNGTILSITEEQLTALGLTVDIINQAANDCACGVLDNTEVRCDKEYICNDGFYEVVVTCFDSNGAETSVTSTLTTIPCDSGIDVEVDFLCNSVTGFFDQIITVFDINGVIESTTTNATTIACPKDCEAIGSKGTLTNWSDLTS